MKKKLIDYTTIYIVLLIVLLAGIFIGGILDRVFYKKEFREEITVNVTPVGLMRDPYKVGYIIKGRIPRQTFRVYFRNGTQISDEWLSYSY